MIRVNVYLLFSCRFIVSMVVAGTLEYIHCIVSLLLNAVFGTVHTYIFLAKDNEKLERETEV